LVLPKAAECPVADLATAGLDSIAVRVPAHPIAQEILRSFDGPVVAPSANHSGHVSPTTAAHVLADLGGRIDLIVDGGATPVGVESTIVACLAQPLGAPALLRPGGVPREAIERVLGQPLAAAPTPADGKNAPRAPGMLLAHYAPHTPLRLDVKAVAPGEALLAFGPQLAEGAAGAMKMLNLSARGDPVEAAANLFSHLRALDALGAKVIAVMPIPDDGLGEAINDRLRRAAR
jgi:L-threonylcarbamoyladenylate synthase